MEGKIGMSVPDWTPKKPWNMKVLSPQNGRVISYNS